MALPWPRGVAGAVVLASLAVACASTRRVAVQAPVDLAIAPIGSSGGIATNGERSPGATCTLRLIATPIQKSAPGCYLDEHISKGEGLLHYACNGDGPAEAVFGPDLYKGKIQDGEVELEHSTELDWEDGCRWGTAAVISGVVVVGGKPTHGKLSWRYRDHVISGSNCSGECTASTSFTVKSADADDAEPDDGDDDEDDD
jgi:hypothetical protein